MTDRQAITIIAAILWAGDEDRNPYDLSRDEGVSNGLIKYLETALNMFQYFKFQNET